CQLPALFSTPNARRGCALPDFWRDKRRKHFAKFSQQLKRQSSRTRKTTASRSRRRLTLWQQIRSKNYELKSAERRTRSKEKEKISASPERMRRTNRDLRNDSQTLQKGSSDFLILNSSFCLDPHIRYATTWPRRNCRRDRARDQ